MLNFLKKTKKIIGCFFIFSLCSIPVYADDIGGVNLWPSFGNRVSPIQVQIGGLNGARYMLPSYATPENISNFGGCQSDYGAFEDKPEGAIRYNCPSVDALKGLLGGLKISNFHTVHSTKLPDLYIPKYYILEQDILISDSSSITFSGDKIIYRKDDYFGGDKSWFGIFDPDISQLGKGFLEGNTTYYHDNKSPNLGIEVYKLDGSRLSPETIRSGVYTLEHYLTPTDITSTFDGNSLFGSSNSLKYVLNQYTPKMEERVFRDVCSTPKSGIRLYKNDNPNYGGGIAIRHYLRGNTRIDAVNNGDCQEVQGLLVSRDGMMNPDDVSISVDEGIGEANSAVYYYATENLTAFNGQAKKILGLRNDRGDGTIVNIGVKQEGVIGSKKHFENQSESQIRDYYVGKTAKLYYLIKITSHYEQSAPGDSLPLSERNKYFAGLDPLNQHYWNESVNNSTSHEYYKYFYSTGPDLGGHGNAYVLLGTAYQGSEQPSSVYELSAPGYAQKASSIGSVSVDKANARIKNMHLNISQGYQATDAKRSRGENSPHLYLMSQTRLVAPSHGDTPNVVMRNYDADMRDVIRSFSTNDDFENNLDYVFAYRSEDSHMKSMKNSARENGLIDINQPQAFWAEANRMASPIARGSCSNLGIESNIFGDVYSFYSPCGQSGVEYSKPTVSGNSNKYQANQNNAKFYQQIEGAITKKYANVVDSINKGTFLQTVANMDDSEVWNQIYMNTNFLVGLPNKEELSCEIALHKMPTTSAFNYPDKLSKGTYLAGTGAGDYANPSLVFTNTPNSVVDKIIVDHILKRNINNTAYANYLNSHYGNQSAGERQDWLTGEKGLITYNCKKNSAAMDEVVVIATTSDQKFRYNNVTKKFEALPANNKLKQPLLAFNTGSHLGYKRVNGLGSQDIENIANYGEIKPIKVFSEGGFTKRQIGELDNNSVAQYDVYLGRKSNRTGLFRGGVEVSIPSGTGKGFYGKVDIVIYDKNRAGGILDSKTYYISTPNEVDPDNPTPPDNTSPPGGTPPQGYCTVLQQSVPFGGKGGSLEQCSVDGEAVTNQYITIEEDNVAGNSVQYKLLCGNLGDEEFIGRLDFNISGLSRYGIRDEEGNIDFSVSVPWGNETFLNNGGFLIKDFRIPGRSQGEITVNVPLKERKVYCPDSPMRASARLSSKAVGGQPGLPSNTDEVKLLECKIPTIEFQETGVFDGNSANDKSYPTWSSAYPFEFSQCGNRINFGMRAKYSCFDKDPSAKNLLVKFKAGTVIDYFNLGRNPFNESNVYASSVWGVVPDKTITNGNVSEVTWDLTTSTHNFSSYANGYFNPNVSIMPPVEGKMRIANSRFTIDVIGTPSLKFDTGNPHAKMNCSGDSCQSAMLTADIALDPVIDDQKFYDYGIYHDHNLRDAGVHIEEIDGTSRIGTRDGVPFSLPFISQLEVTNPQENLTIFGMTAMNFDYHLNPTNLTFFSGAKASEVYPNSDKLSVERGRPVWNNINLPAGQTQIVAGGIQARADIGLAKNSGKPTMNFLDNESLTCNYGLRLEPWSAEIFKNPITLDVFRYEEVENDSPMRDPADSQNIIEQHIPGDTMKIVMDFKNNNNHLSFNNTYVRIKFDTKGEGIIDDPNVQLDLTRLFQLSGTQDGEWIVSDTNIKCKMEPDNLLCELVNPIAPGETVNAIVYLKINIETQFYKQLQSIDNNVDWKHFFPVVTKEILYGSPDLDKVTLERMAGPIKEVVYYTSSENELPSGGNEDDIGSEHIDFSVPENRVVRETPKDSSFAFYVGIPYATIKNELINSSPGRLSPGEIGHFRTTIRNIGRASLKNPEIFLDLYPNGLNEKWVDTAVQKIVITPSINGTNIPSARTTDFLAINNDGDDSNDVNTSNIEYIGIAGGPTETDVFNIVNNRINYYTSARPLIIDGSWDLSGGGELEARADVLFLQLKTDKYPQIDCKSPQACQRAGQNPKGEEFRGQLNIPFVGDTVVAKDVALYNMHFPILKSLLFAKTNNNFKPEDGSNLNIQGKLNSPDTTVTYRVDNFIPAEYQNFVRDKVGKARDAKAHIRLPHGVTYVPNSLKYVSKIDDGTFDPTKNVIVNLGYDPYIRNVREGIFVQPSSPTYSFDNDFLTNGEWNKVQGTNSPQFAIMKGTPFSFNLGGKTYNYYRITEKGSIALGAILQDSNINDVSPIMSMGATITPHGPITITFKEDTINLTINGDGVAYTDIDGNQKTTQGNGAHTISVQKDSSITTSSNVEFSNGAYSVKSIEGDYSLDDGINYSNEAQWSSLALISPLFASIDTTKNDEYGVYERVNRGNHGKVYSIDYIWYGENRDNGSVLKFGLTLYGAQKENDIKFFYGDIGGNFPNGVITGISDGDAIVQRSPYSMHSGYTNSLSNASDVIFTAAEGRSYQEIILPIGHSPEVIDPIRNRVLHPQEKDYDGTFLKGPGKDGTAYVYQFNIKIATNEKVCGTEYTTSLGGSTLQWGKLVSSRSDKEDIDSFCFSAQKPTIKILDNASYARGGYKTATNNCTVSHLALMGFNARAIGWNANTNNGCWLTYNIQKYEKDLSIYTSSPYDLLGLYKDKIDTRPIDTSLMVNTQHLGIEAVKQGQVIQISIPGEGMKNVNQQYPNFQAVGMKLLTDKNILIWGNYGQNAVLIRSLDGGETFTEQKLFTGKNILAGGANAQNIMFFFNDGTYSKNVNAGAGQWIENKTLPDNHQVNAIHIVSNTQIFLIANDGAFYESTNGGETFTKRSLKEELGLFEGEHLVAIDSHAGKEIWIGTNKGSILYSGNSGEQFVKQTTSGNVDHMLIDFEDGSHTAQTSGIGMVGTSQEQLLSTATSKSYIDSVSNGKSLKYFYLDYDMFVRVGALKNIIPSNGYLKTGLQLDFGAYKEGTILKGDMYIDILLADKEVTGDIEKIILSDATDTNQGTKVEIINPGQFNTDGSGVLKEGFNTIKVSFNSASVPNKYNQTGNISQIASNMRVDVIFQNKDVVASQSSLIGNFKMAKLATPQIINEVVENSRDAIRTNIVFDRTNTSNAIDLSSYLDASGSINGSLMFDMYLSDATQGQYGGLYHIISSMKLGDGQFGGITILSPISKRYFVGELKQGWNTIRIPLSKGSDGILYSNFPTNWQELYLEISTGTEKKIMGAIDNIRFSANEDISMREIKFFNSKEGITFATTTASTSVGRKLFTLDNTNWTNAENIDKGGVQKISAFKFRGRELYGFIQSGQGVFSIYSLDKGINTKEAKLQNVAGISAVDMLDYNKGYLLDSSFRLHKIKLKDD